MVFITLTVTVNCSDCDCEAVLTVSIRCRLSLSQCRLRILLSQLLTCNTESPVASARPCFSSLVGYLEGGGTMGQSRVTQHRLYTAQYK